MKQLTYRVLLNHEPEGGYTATVPTLPGCITYGETVDEAIAMTREAIVLYIESLKAHGQLYLCTTKTCPLEHFMPSLNKQVSIKMTYKIIYYWPYDV